MVTALDKAMAGPILSLGSIGTALTGPPTCGLAWPCSVHPGGWRAPHC